jgi:hypothetical protein
MGQWLVIEGLSTMFDTNTVGKRQKLGRVEGLPWQRTIENDLALRVTL